MSAARRITDELGVTVAYSYRDTIIEKHYFADGPSLFSWVVPGFGPDGWSEHARLSDAKAFIDCVKDGR